MPTIADVARRAGVSTATVSRFLRGDRVRAAADIRQAIEDLSFWPSPAARSLKSGITYAIGVVVPDIANPFFAAVVKGVEGVSREGPYNIFLCDTDESTEREQRVLADLIRRVDGIILAPATEQDETPLQLREAGVPTVFVDRELHPPATFDSVLVDNAGGARQAAEHLMSLGHRRIGVISGPVNTTPGRGRHEGFLSALADRGVELPAMYLQAGDFREAGGYQATLRLLGVEPPPTAIFSANNLMTIGALKALHDMRVAVPAQMSIIGFDDLDLGAVLRPALTVIDRPMVEQGALAMRLLLNRLGTGAGGNDLDGAPRTVVLDTRLLVRQSCSKPAVADVRLSAVPSAVVPKRRRARLQGQAGG